MFYAAGRSAAETASHHQLRMICTPGSVRDAALRKKRTFPAAVESDQPSRAGMRNRKKMR
jgi:hypothetical protein